MSVKYFDLDDAKNAKLRAERGIGFEDVVFHIERGDLLDILEHPNPSRYAGQRSFVRLSSKDLEAIQKRALAEGLPYQTLVVSVLHK
jgi:hypothetical protein